MCKYNYFNVKKQTAGGENFENFRCQICNFVKETLILEDQNFNYITKNGKKNTIV